jgi:hypothetical protein
MTSASTLQLDLAAVATPLQATGIGPRHLGDPRCSPCAKHLSRALLALLLHSRRCCELPTAVPSSSWNVCPACAQTAAPERVPRLLPPRSEALRGVPLPAPAQRQLAAMEAAVGRCDLSPDAPLVVYVSKMVAVPASALPR